MRLGLLTESSTLTLYKGVLLSSGLANWPAHEVGSRGEIIPGFLSDLKVATIYSDPELTGSSDEPGMIAEFNINIADIKDRTESYIRWCDAIGEECYDVSGQIPEQWTTDGSIWTVSDSGSGHGEADIGLGDYTFVYCAAKIPYTVVAFFNNAEEQTRYFKRNRV